VIVADAGADAGSLWLRISIAVVPPVLAAIIAGFFALSNTVNRRIERLKNLNDIRVSEEPEWINPGCTLERIMLRELEALDRATTPIVKWNRRVRLLVIMLISLAYIYFALGLLQVINLMSRRGEIVSIFISLGFFLGLLLSTFMNRWMSKSSASRTLMNKRFSRRLTALDERAAQADEPDAESEQQDAPKSESSAETSGKTPTGGPS
jgi:hypothetical protein